MIAWFDIKKSWSVFVSDTGYSIVVVLSMAFSLAVSLFLLQQIYIIQYKPLEFSHPEQLMSITREENGMAYPTGGINYFDFMYYEAHQKSFQALARYEDRLASFETDKVTESIQGAAVNAEFFQITSGINPLLGRTLTTKDNIHGSPLVAVIGYDLWQRVFQGVPDVLGKTFTLNGLVYSIVGVMPKGFNFPIRHEAWVSYPMWNMPEASILGWNTLIGRLKPGVSVEEARLEMKSLAAQIRKDYPVHFKGKDVQVVPYTHAFLSPILPNLRIMLIVSIAILLMGDFSVCNLLIVRMLENKRESTIKVALGLPAWRIACRPLLESFWLCSLAGILAVLLCFLFTQAAKAFMYAAGPYWWALNFQPIVVGAAGVFVWVMWLLTGVIPVTMAVRSPSKAALAGGKKGGITGKSAPFMSALIGLQVVCALVLMVFTGLSLNALIRSVNADYGVNTNNIMVADIRLSEFSHPTLADRVGYYQTLAQEISKIKGTKSVAFTSALAGYGGSSITYRSPAVTTASATYTKVFNISVSENYFNALGVKLIKGRFFNRYDEESSQLVAIVDERTAHLIDPAGQVLGKQIQIDIENNGPLVTIVGVIAPLLQGSPLVDVHSVSGAIYRPMRQLLPFWGAMHVLVAVDIESPIMAEEIQQAGRRVTTQIAVASIMRFQDRLLANTQNIMAMVYNFLPAALLAFFMATLGIYGISSRIALQNTNDIGIMKALGATDTHILKAFLKKTGVLLLISFTVGLAVLVFALPVVISGNFVFSASTLTLIVLAIMGCIFVMVMLASIIPISRINRLSPQLALNFELGR